MDNRQIQFREGLSFQNHSQPSPGDLRQLQQLFQVGAFWAEARSLEDLAVAVANSKPVISAWDGDRLIGFARATSDGIYRATLWDVVIDPDYRGAGLGRKLVEVVLAHPLMNRVERIYLMTTHQQQFYQQIGFEENTSTTMVLYNQVILPGSSNAGAVAVEAIAEVT